MALLDIRQRTGWLFMAMTVGHIILISVQVNTQRGVPLFEAATFGLFAELQRATTSAVRSVEETWQNYFALQQVRRENEQLKAEVDRLQIRLQQERAVAEQSRVLQELLDLRAEIQVSSTGAAVIRTTVIGAGASPDFRTVTIDKGTRDGLRQDMPVIAPAGVVGRIILPTARASKVQLLIDRNAAAGALVERSRAQGVVVGSGTDKLRMEYIAGTADVKVGDRVVTSGIDGIYPKGLLIGQIQSVQHGAGEFSGIVINPAVDFSALETVLVVVSPVEASEDALQPGAASAPARQDKPTQAGGPAEPPPRNEPGATGNGAR